MIAKKSKDKTGTFIEYNGDHHRYDHNKQATRNEIVDENNAQEASPITNQLRNKTPRVDGDGTCEESID